MKSEEQIRKMRAAGSIVWQAHQAAAARMEPGVTTAQIDEAVERTIDERGGIPLFKGVPGRTPFPAATCISINEQVVHGIPGPRELREGDVVSIDIGVKLDGWCADAAVTHPVGSISPDARKLLDTTEEALRRAIRSLRDQTRWRPIARQIESLAKSAGLSVIEELVGHGIGREMWELPQVPNYETTRLDDIELATGLVLAIEPMLNLGSREVRLLEDHWTIVTADGAPSAHFEHTVAITDDGPQVLTCGPDGEGWSL